MRVFFQPKRGQTFFLNLSLLQCIAPVTSAWKVVDNFEKKHSTKDILLSLKLPPEAVGPGYPFAVLSMLDLMEETMEGFHTTSLIQGELGAYIRTENALSITSSCIAEKNVPIGFLPTR